MTAFAAHNAALDDARTAYDAAVAAYLAHLVKGRVTRYEVPGVHAFNFVCEQALDGGGVAEEVGDGGSGVDEQGAVLVDGEAGAGAFEQGEGTEAQD